MDPQLPMVEHRVYLSLHKPRLPLKKNAPATRLVEFHLPQSAPSSCIVLETGWAWSKTALKIQISILTSKFVYGKMFTVAKVST